MPVEIIENKIVIIRGQKVMLDRDLAELYGVETKYLNRQVRRNQKRFPPEFMFQLSEKERDELVTIWHRFNTMKHASSLPYAFTEYGAVMLASILNSERAVRFSIYIVKAFIKLRQVLANNEFIEKKLNKIEGKVKKHGAEIQSLTRAIKFLLLPPEKPKRLMGFRVDRD
ncbi:MAG: ORF6N domain-containing protein [Candidatus Margulisbacteria bacterium]|nr:ORF6N domain-containing protein [Candidatus Margulisiibacteriota bacterium]